METTEYKIEVKRMVDCGDEGAKHPEEQLVNLRRLKKIGMEGKKPIEYRAEVRRDGQYERPPSYQKR